jgi:S-DNA-T family DNA segregation ATPase FtsK/SpoIIIE
MRHAEQHTDLSDKFQTQDTSQDGHWYRARSLYVSEHTAEQAAQAHAHLAPSWDEITAHLPNPVNA